MSKIKTCGLDQYGDEPFEQQHFGTAGVEAVKIIHRLILVVLLALLDNRLPRGP